MQKTLLTLLTALVVLISASPIYASSTLNENQFNKNTTRPLNINNNFQLNIFNTELRTLTKNAEMIALIQGEPIASADTMWKAGKESKYASNIKPNNWGTVKQESKGTIGTLIYVNSTTYNIVKNTKTGLGKVKCTSVLKIGNNKINPTNTKCVNK